MKDEKGGTQHTWSSHKMQYGENSSCKASMEDYLSPLDYTPLGEITVLNKQETM